MIERAAALARDDDALVATREWMLAGLPQMCAERAGGCRASSRSTSCSTAPEAGASCWRRATTGGPSSEGSAADAADGPHDGARFRVVGHEALRLARRGHRRHRRRRSPASSTPSTSSDAHVRPPRCGICRQRNDAHFGRAGSEAATEFDVDLGAGERDQRVGHRVDDPLVAAVGLGALAALGAAPCHRAAVVAPVGVGSTDAPSPDSVSASISCQSTRSGSCQHTDGFHSVGDSSAAERSDVQRAALATREARDG